jgi:hypothetical protein
LDKVCSHFDVKQTKKLKNDICIGHTQNLKNGFAGKMQLFIMGKEMMFCFG